MAIPSKPHKLVQNWEPLSNQNYELWEKLACYKIMGPDLGNKFHNGGSLQKQEVFFSISVLYVEKLCFFWGAKFPTETF